MIVLRFVVKLLLVCVAVLLGGIFESGWSVV